MAAFLFLLASLGSGVNSARCDLVEINHYCPGGRQAFVQAIAWDWSPDYRRFHAQQWVMIQRWRRTESGVELFQDTEPKRISIRTRLFRETWTEHDPERENQYLFPINERRKVF